jgi:hypothetical protein
VPASASTIADASTTMCTIERRAHLVTGSVHRAEHLRVGDLRR